VNESHQVPSSRNLFRKNTFQSMKNIFIDVVYMKLYFGAKFETFLQCNNIKLHKTKWSSCKQPA